MGIYSRDKIYGHERRENLNHRSSCDNIKEQEGRGKRPRSPNQELKKQSNNHLKEAGQASGDLFSSIRADKDVDTFVADLRQNKKKLLSLAHRLMRNRGYTQDERSAYLSVGIYLDVVLKQHVFDIDPFASKRLGDEQVQEDREVLAFDLITMAASRWLKNHPGSKSAKAVSKMGHYAFSDHHQRLLQEMWPSISRVVAASYSYFTS